MQTLGNTGKHENIIVLFYSRIKSAHKKIFIEFSFP